MASPKTKTAAGTVWDRGRLRLIGNVGGRRHMAKASTAEMSPTAQSAAASCLALLTAAHPFVRSRQRYHGCFGELTMARDRSMSISYSCECVKRFRAKGDRAGQRAMCPACHREFRFPVSSVPEPSVAPPLDPSQFSQIQIDEEDRPVVTVPPIPMPQSSDRRRSLGRLLPSRMRPHSVPLHHQRRPYGPRRRAARQAMGCGHSRGWSWS
jgi:hypothetical protein